MIRWLDAGRYVICLWSPQNESGSGSAIALSFLGIISRSPTAETKTHPAHSRDLQRSCTWKRKGMAPRWFPRCQSNSGPLDCELPILSLPRQRAYRCFFDKGQVQRSALSITSTRASASAFAIAPNACLHSSASSVCMNTHAGIVQPPRPI